MKCDQCGTEFEGNFCPDCGAKRVSAHTAGTKPKKKKKPFFLRWWFILLAVIVVGGVALSVGGDGEKIVWSDMVLGDMLPEPPANKGEIYTNSSENLDIEINDISDKQYADYVDACEKMGFAVEAETTSYTYSAYHTDGYKLNLSHYSKNMSIHLEAPMEIGSISWPTSAVGQLLPTPESTVGKFLYEYADSFAVYIGNTNISDYAEYIAACSACGFIVDYYKSDKVYYADNTDGYHIWVEYKGNNIMYISIASPDEKTDIPTQPSTQATTENTTSDTYAEPSTSENTANLASLRSDFKEAMDSYEEFMDEYVAFMKKYADSDGTNLSILADYAKYMSKYADMIKKFEKWESEDLNAAETAYYIEVQSRVAKKLLEVG